MLAYLAMKKNILFYFSLHILLFISSCAHQNHNKASWHEKNQYNSEIAKNSPYVLLVSIDGFRYDYSDKFSPPHIKEFFESGSVAKSLIPSYPSKTFPNHYTIVTGLYPQNHGIVANSFYDFEREENKNIYKLSLKSAVTDGSWYDGIPIWVAAEQAGMLCGIYFWPGSEADIDHTTPAYVKSYDGKIPNDERVETVLTWLNKSEDLRPHFLTLYFSDVDSAGHHFGTTSSEVKKAVLSIDESLGKLFKGLSQLPFAVNVILVSDHGMQDLDEKKIFYIDEYTNLNGLTLGDLGPLVSIYSPNKDRGLIQNTYKNLKEKSSGKHFKVYLRNEVPKHLHFSSNARIGDIVVIADAPYSLGVHDNRFNMIKASHGYDSTKFSTMRGIFYAKGPNIKKRKTIPSFENIHIYPFIMKILGLEIKSPIDGRAEVLAPFYLPSN